MRAFHLSMLLSILILGLALTYKNHSQQDPHKCHALLNNGRWLNKDTNPSRAPQWQATGCLMHVYNEKDALQCLNHRKLHFIGDSIVRQLFWATARKLDPRQAESANVTAHKHSDLLYTAANATLSFTWDPYLNSSVTTSILKNDSEVVRTMGVMRGIVIGAGLWHARYLEQEYSKRFQSALSSLTSEWKHGTTSRKGNRTLSAIEDGHVPLIFHPPSLPAYNLLSSERAETLTKARMTTIIGQLRQFQRQNNVEVAWSSLIMTHGHALNLLDDGIHVSSGVALSQADIVLNRLCNELMRHSNQGFRATCCIVRPQQKVTRFLLILMLTASTWMSYKLCKRQTLATGRFHRRCPRLEDLAPVILSLSVTLCYIADRTKFLEAAAKPASTHCLVVLVFICLALGLIRVRSIDAVLDSQTLSSEIRLEDLLSRQQTEEWKGWMQVVILLYHYCGMSRILWIYQIVRVLVGSYLFLTGYGHANYFLSTQDFSIKRTLTVLLRLNLLTCMLSLVMHNHYDFYYFPGLASLWFLVVYATLWTHSKSVLSMGNVLLRVVFSGFCLHLLLQTPHTLEKAFETLKNAGGPSINAYEFRFRVSLDMYAPYLGILLAATQYHFKKTVLPSKLTTIAAIVVLGYLVAAQLFDNKFTYNRWHPYVSPLMIIAYLVLRCRSHRVRRSYSISFAWLGRCSLETFVLQYHIWLATDTKAILRLGLIDRPLLSSSTTIASYTFWLETILITVYFLWISGLVANATTNLTNLVTKGSTAHKRGVLLGYSSRIHPTIGEKE